ncbi:MAG: NAD(P)-binding domain-containing protein, partial [Gemmatimonas sp.]
MSTHSRPVIPCAVIGGGAWGTAVADRLVRNGHPVQLWAREPDVVEAINARHENPRFLPGAPLAPALRAAADMDVALRGAALVIYAAPSHVLRAVVASAHRAVADGVVLAVLT